jgi:hypothetical protein
MGRPEQAARGGMRKSAPPAAASRCGAPVYFPCTWAGEASSPPTRAQGPLAARDTPTARFGRITDYFDAMH